VKATGLWVGLVLGLALLTFHHNRTVWTSERALWANAVRWAPDHPRPWINLGRAWLLEGDQALARQAWQEASRVSRLPGRSSYERSFGTVAAETNLAWLDVSGHHYPEALARLNYALSVDPTFPQALQLRALTRLKLGDCAGADADQVQFRVNTGNGGMLPAC